MLESSGFKGIMTKHSYTVVKDNVYVAISIKHISSDPVQTFLRSFEKSSGIQHVYSLFDMPISWNTLKLKVDDYPFNYDVEFDQIAFKARLVEIIVNKKTKDGVDSFEYILDFRKDIEGDKDSITAKKYLKYKEENEDGKKVIKEFDVKLTPIDEDAIKDVEN